LRKSLQQKIEWAEKQPWCQPMKDCTQEAAWHGEGDVWTHTLMTCEELDKLLITDENESFLNDMAVDVLEWAALLHDVGKPSVTTVEDGKIRSPAHSKRGARMANMILFERMNAIHRASVCNLTRYHERPFHIIDSAEDERSYVAFTSWMCSNFLLYILSVADAQGRIYSDIEDTLATLDCWKMICQENHCFSQLYPFRNDHARFLFYQGKLSSFHYDPFPPQKHVTMLSGLPGSGKTFYALNNQRLSALPHISLDDIREDMGVSPATDTQGKVIQRAREDCRKHLRRQEEFVFDATNLTRNIRDRWVRLFTSYDMGVDIIYFEPDLQTILTNNAGRENPVPESVIRRLISILEIPNMGEAHRVQFVSLC